MRSSLPKDFLIHRIHSITTNFNDSGTISARTERPCSALVYKYEGETVYQCGTEAITSNASCMILLPKGIAYTWKCHRAGHCIIVEFDTDDLPQKILALDVQNSDRIRARLQKSEAEGLLMHPTWQMEACRAIYDILLSLEHSGGYVPHSKAEKLRPALEYMTLHSNEALSNDLLASLAGMSTVYFRKLFTAVYGISPMNYLTELRMQKAKQLLGSDYGGITEVATAIWYRDIYHFSKAFKKSTGLSPMQYVKKQQTLSHSQ